MPTQGGISVVVLGKERHPREERERKSLKPLALQPDKAQRQLGRQNWGWLSSEDLVGSQKEAAIQAWTNVIIHGTGRSCFSSLC